MNLYLIILHVTLDLLRRLLWISLKAERRITKVCYSTKHFASKLAHHFHATIVDQSLQPQILLMEMCRQKKMWAVKFLSFLMMIPFNVSIIFNASIQCLWKGSLNSLKEPSLWCVSRRNSAVFCHSSMTKRNISIWEYLLMQWVSSSQGSKDVWRVFWGITYKILSSAWTGGRKDNAVGL